MHKKLISTLVLASILAGNIPPVFADTSKVEVSKQNNNVIVTSNEQKTDEEQGKAKNQVSITKKIEDKSSVVTTYNGYGSDMHNKYAEVYQIKEIKSVKNNGGQYSSSSLDKAFDNNLNTHWETNKPNNTNFKNEIIITFNEIEEINRILYSARKDAGNKGFAEEFSIYGSLTDEGEDFELVATGKANKQSGVIEIKFNTAEFKRLKFVFDKASGNWASASELNFFKEDTVLDEVNNIFTNGLMLELTTKYQDKNILNEYIEKLKAHPMADKYEGLINAATNIMNGNVINKDSIINLPQKGHEVDERNRTKLTFAMFAHEPTGIFLCKNETLKVYVDADENGVLPELVVGMNHFIKLVPGYNEIVLPSKFAGPSQIYLANRAYSNQQAYAPSVRIEGGSEYPVYVHGKTDPKEFMDYLSEYVKAGITIDSSEFADGNIDNKRPNMAVISSDNILIETSALGAYKGLTEQLKATNEYVDATIDTYEDMYREYVNYSGFDYDLNPEEPWNLRPLGKFMLIGSHSGPFGWAQHGFSGYNGGGGNRDSGFWVSLVQADIVRNGGWALFHEVAHQYDSSLLGTSESTNNLYSLLMQDKYLDENRMVKDDRWEKHFTNYHNTKEYPNDQLFLGAITYQLEGVYGNHIYGDAQRIARENKNNWMSGLNTKEKHAVAISMGLGINVIPHYEYYGISISDKAKSLVSDLPVIDIKSYYVNDKVFKDDAIAFTKENVKPTIKASGSVEVTLTLGIDEPENALLVYEIYRDGKYLGVTYGNTFVDKATEENKNHVYTVKAYDRKLNVSLESEPAIKNISEPKLTTMGDIVLPIHTKFNPLDYIKATDSKGVDISDRIEVLNNDVDTSAKGTYTVEYAVTDTFGNVSNKQCEVRVVSEMNYLSDLTPTSKSGYYKKDTDNQNDKISLLSENGEVEYTKGIGAHANTTVTYNLEQDKYDFFEAYIGLDDYVRKQNKASVIFEVWADGEKVYESNQIKSNQNQEFIKIPLDGVKELKLVTKDAGNGNSYDHSMWADAKLVSQSSAPELNIGETYVTMPLGEEVDLMNGISATDVEDGDLTSKIEIESNGFDMNKSGTYKITYTVTDSEGNVSQKTKTIVIYSSINYASDNNFEIIKQGWGGVKKDKSPNNDKISLLVNGTETAFEKGIGAHANSEIKFNLEGKGFEAFHAVLGIDDNVRTNNNASAKFKILADGKEVYASKVFYKDTNAEEIIIPLDGVSELTLITDQANANDWSDQTVWADAKFLVTDSKPELTIPKDIALKVGENLDDIYGDYSAIDAEDGDLTNNVKVSGIVDFNRPGKYEITYTVVDSNGNKIEKTRNISIVNMDDYTYLTDYNYKTAQQGWNSLKIDKAVSNNKLRLTNDENQEVIYDRGLGTHSTSTIVYDLSDKDYGFFTSYVGVDRAMYNTVGSVEFKVYVDGEEAYNSGLMTSKDAQKYVEVNLAEAKELKLVVTDGGNGNGSDHANWADTKLHFANENRVDFTLLEDKIKEIEAMDLSKYTEESKIQLTEAVLSAKEFMKNTSAKQEDIDAMINILEEKVKLLEITSKVEEYEKLKNLAEKIEGITKDMIKGDHVDAKWYNLGYCKSEAKRVLEDSNSTEEDFKSIITLINYCLFELDFI